MKKFKVTLIRSTCWTVSVEAKDKDDAEFTVQEMETSELIEECDNCEVTDIYCHVEEA